MARRQTRKTSNDVGPTRLHFIKENLSTCSPQKISHKLGAGAFASLLCAWVAIRIHGWDANKRLTKLHNVRGMGRHAALLIQDSRLGNQDSEGLTNDA
jgi:hypothetical protein